MRDAFAAAGSTDEPRDRRSPRPHERDGEVTGGQDEDILVTASGREEALLGVDHDQGDAHNGR